MTCGILFPRNSPVEPLDEHGCILEDAHNSAHVFKDEDGRFIEWEDDYSCTCGCWDDWENGIGRPAWFTEKLKNKRND